MRFDAHRFHTARARREHHERRRPPGSLVKPGDTLAKDQPVLELETDKATIEVPSSVAGEVGEVKVNAGDTVKVGQAILSVVESGSAPAPKPATAPSPPTAAAPPAVEPKPPASASTGGNPIDLDESPDEGSLEHPIVEVKNVSVEPDKPGVKEQRGQKVVDISRGSRATTDSSAPPELPAPAAPSVRRMARELGVDIHDVTGTGSGGRISADDVKAHVNRLVRGAAGAPAAPADPLPDFSRWGEVERRPMRGVRRKTAQHLAAAWASIPHVTQHELADIHGARRVA